MVQTVAGFKMGKQTKMKS